MLSVKYLMLYVKNLNKGRPKNNFQTCRTVREFSHGQKYFEKFEFLLNKTGENSKFLLNKIIENISFFKKLRKTPANIILSIYNVTNLFSKKADDQGLYAFSVAHVLTEYKGTRGHVAFWP